MKLRKSLEGNYEKLPPKFPIKEDSPPLMFKKKYKYKSPSIDSGEKPKGFDNTKDLHVVNKDQEQVDESIPIIEPINKLVNGSEKSKQRATKTESIKGASKEIRKPRGFGQESQSNTSLSSKHDDSYSNGSLKGKKGRNKKSVRDFWWTNLPYVLAVLMQRGGESEESEGLFTLRSNFKSKNGGLSHTVAFEDRGDATNFCYLLESFFQDLEDFTTNIIPIPTNELEEAVKSEIMKVVVVKKGQLELYVGQPLTHVESALRTLIQQQTD
ncbi:unnamed protein product [Lactuca virosa]|uniref:Uncharacterized protein n=1 Tax=Lactuca virosa TaxID=75947 RepID=A0AAU9N047_9ASTR|nr:unnamed protein product [Lactuca virosa]